MAETEVEIILREIRERVLSQQAAAAPARVTGGNEGNGASDSIPQIAPAEDAKAVTSENLALINSYLTTTGRAWDRLPPLVSNRSGLAARLELWVKRHFKRATRWYSWEQVNFNAAVHHAIRDMLPVLTAYERELGQLRTKLEAEVERRTEMERVQLTELKADIQAIRAVVETERQATGQLNASLANLVNELREREGHLLDEQRVSFKQLALESSEAAVLEDRARRKVEALLEELMHRMERLENE
jgi:hypothetical protein